MEAVLPVLVGILYAAGIFLMLQRNIIKLALGLILLTNATNLFIFTAGRLTFAIPPIIPLEVERLEGTFANPVSEALILTAIVIGFGLLSFALALIYGLSVKFSSMDPEEIGEAHE
jgi:multicomponent Na+:H+ antiporter subunit C